MAPNEWFETNGSKPEMRESRSDDILRHSPMQQNMSVVPAIARSKKRREIQEGESTSPSWAVSALRVKRSPQVRNRNVLGL